LLQQDPWHKEGKQGLLPSSAELCKTWGIFFPLQFSLLLLLSTTSVSVWWHEQSHQARHLLTLQTALFCMSYPPDKAAHGGSTPSPAMVAWGCWCWACIGPLWQKWNIKGLFTHMLVHTLQDHGAATLPGLWVGDKDETAQPCRGIGIFSTVHGSLV